MGSNEVQILRHCYSSRFFRYFYILFIFVPTFYFYSLHFNMNIGTFYSLHLKKLARYFSFKSFQWRYRYYFSHHQPFAGSLIDRRSDQSQSAILSDKAVWKVSRLTLEDLNLKNGVYWHLSAVKTTFLPMFIHVYLML